MDLVLDVPHAPDVLGQVLGEPLRVTVRNASGERHLAVHHANFNVARVEIPCRAILSQMSSLTRSSDR